MRLSRYMRPVAILLTLVTPLTQLQPVYATSPGNVPMPQRPAPPVRDVALDRVGTLVGQVVDEHGVPQAQQQVVVRRVNIEAAEAKTLTDATGRFAVVGLQGGLHELSVGHVTTTHRLWTPAAAPPAAAREVLLVSSDAVQRGQRPIADLLTGPVLIGLIIAAAIAIPIAIHNSRKDAS